MPETVGVELLRRHGSGDPQSWDLLADGRESVVSAPRIEHFASVAGGRNAFNVTSGVVQIGAAGEQQLAAIVNPADSPVIIKFHLGEFGSGSDALFRRWSGASLSDLTNPIAPRNMSGGPTTCPLRMYAGQDFTATGGAPSKTAHIGAFAQYQTELAGAAWLLPGRSLYWTIENASGGVDAFTGSVYFELWQEPA